MKLSDRKYPSDFPPEEFHIIPQANKNSLEELRDLVEKASGEKAIDTFLKSNINVLAKCMNFTQYGHHGTWVIPQQEIRPHLTSSQKGLKPDYLVGGKGSDGYRWFVVELKASNENIFVEKNGNVYFSSIVNKGICQLLSYIDYCSSAQAYMRDSLKLNGFREPEGFLVVGRESELENSSKKQDMKAAWNRITSNRIQIRTYDALLRSNSTSWAEDS